MTEEAERLGVLLAATTPSGPHAAFTLPRAPVFESRGGGLAQELRAGW